MIITTTGSIDGIRIIKVIGLVSASTIRARHIGRDIMAGLRTIVGGEVVEYTRLLGESRAEAVRRLEQRALSQGANAVVGMRFMTSMVTSGAAEILAYGTAVVVDEETTT